jgi:hypothetical protein
MSKLLLTIAFAVAVCQAQEKCYVFYPTTERPQSIQEKLQGALSGVTVTVFGRLNDLNVKTETDPPDAIISKPSLIGQFSDFSVKLNGVRKGKTGETYVILSIGTPVDIKTIGPETTIGVIDVLGRTGMKSFISQFFPVEPKIKRVTKVEDLLPLLTFNMAAGILIEDIFVNYFKSTSQLDFKIIPLPPAQSGIIALGVNKNGKADKTTAVLKKADKTICSIFEVDLWK